MGDRPVTIRLLDPPLHEFLPQSEVEIAEVAALMHVSAEKIAAKVTELHEINPMLGHRGCRLAITSPAIAVMQTEAIIGAALEVKKETGAELVPEIMIPLVNSEAELKYVKHIVTRTAEDCIRKSCLAGLFNRNDGRDTASGSYSGRDRQRRRVLLLRHE